MRDAELRERIRALRAPDEPGAEERARRVVLAAFAARDPARRRTAVRVRASLAAATLAAVAAVAALTPPGDAVADWLRDVLRPGRHDARPALVSLPSAGRLLVTSLGGAWIVHADGSRRRLGAYSQATWSPHGRYVAVSRGSELAAVDPRGNVRWSLARAAPIDGARWSPSGFRIAYRTGRSLRIVAGDGSGDRLIRAAVSPVAPAWRPGGSHILAFAARGRVVVADDRGRRLWRVAPGRRVAQLDWTPAGRLVVRSRDDVLLYGAGGRLVARAPLPGPVDAAALAPDGRTLALALAGRTGRVVALSLPRLATPPRTLFRGAGTFDGLAWSADGRWLLIAWRDADQWLFVRSAQVRRITAVSAITRTFGAGRRPQSFPGLAGWCCPGG